MPSGMHVDLLLPVVILLFSAAARAQAPARCEQRPGAVPLEDAMETALTCHPELRLGRARVAEARGRLRGAETLPYNPQLSVGAARREGGGAVSLDLEASLSQQLQIAGQRGRRIAAARRALEAAEARLVRRRRLVLARVHQTYASALAASRLVQIARRDRDLAARLHEVARRRFEAGSATRLDLNTARAELGRAEAALAEAEARDEVARAAFAEAMGLLPSSAWRPAGALIEQLPAPPPLSRALEQASERRADLLALRAEARAARARLRLARARGWPDVTLGVFVAREEGSDTIVGGSLSVPIPLFQRNQGGVAVARAGIERAEAAARRGEQAMRREVLAADARFRTRSQAAERLRALVMGSMEENVRLLERAVEAGSLGWAEVTMLRRSLVEAQRQWVGAELGRHLAWIELMIAAGREPRHGLASAAEGSAGGRR